MIKLERKIQEGTSSHKTSVDIKPLSMLRTSDLWLQMTYPDGLKGLKLSPDIGVCVCVDSYVYFKYKVGNMKKPTLIIMSMGEIQKGNKRV